MSPEEEIVLVCIPTTIQPHVPSHEETCLECHASVWVSDRAPAHAGASCTTCFAASSDEQPELSPEAMAEVLEYMRDKGGGLA